MYNCAVGVWVKTCSTSPMVSRVNKNAIFCLFSALFATARFSNSTTVAPAMAMKSGLRRKWVDLSLKNALVHGENAEMETCMAMRSKMRPTGDRKIEVLR